MGMIIIWKNREIYNQKFHRMSIFFSTISPNVDMIWEKVIKIPLKNVGKYLAEK